MKCDECSSEDQVVKTERGNFCQEHYRYFKRGKAQGQVVGTVTCENCGGPNPGDHCWMCGHWLNSDGSVLRIGGHPNC